MDDFLFIENDWLYREFERLEFVRSMKYQTFKAALNLLHQRRPSGFEIVETGTQRVIDDPGGCSTLLFAAYCARYNGTLTTVDINPRYLEVAKEATRAYAEHVNYIESDSIKFLTDWTENNGYIDLLYLDSYDCSPIGDSSPAQLHQVKEYVAAEHALSPRSILVMDDNNFPSGGKTRLLKQQLWEKGWECILDMGQSLWQRK